MSPQYKTVGGYINTDPHYISPEEEGAMANSADNAAPDALVAEIVTRMRQYAPSLRGVGMTASDASYNRTLRDADTLEEIAARNEEHYQAAMAMAEKHRKEVVASAAREAKLQRELDDMRDFIRGVGINCTKAAGGSDGK